MSTMFSIEMLPAGDGDCLWIEYGKPEKPHRILIDGGRTKTRTEILKRAKQVPAGQLKDGKVQFELLVVSHVDNDHIQGVLSLLERNESPLHFADIWFNGYRHLDQSEAYGPVEGERLTDAILDHNIAWNSNESFSGRAVVVSAELDARTVSLPGEMSLKLLSPSREKLEALKPKWESACQEAGLDPKVTPAVVPEAPAGWQSMGPLDIDGLAGSEFDPDETETNGSSIAFIAEYGGKRILLAGDAHADLLLASIKRIKGTRKRLPLDAFKLPHHGSHRNLDRGLLEAIDCPMYLISTGSSKLRPARQTIARIIKFGGDQPELVFNSKSDNCLFWKDLSEEYHYSVRYPGSFGTDPHVYLKK